ncbi:MAG: UDP-2,3-diacylglucosamine diphosphatase [Pasteurellaceae bacterium]|nr:UDP-2,3-diacylglucosamine diphosphatase [Pasteurellaceae bacterium]
MNNTYFIADLHLSEHQPHLTELFHHILAQHLPNAERLYILGDLFDFWIGDDENSPLIRQVKTQLHRLTQQGVQVFFMRGNRDFLIGKKFAQDCGLTLLPDYQCLDLYGTRTLICHGDTLCTDDVNYQKFRQRVHKKWLQRLFLWLPLSLRLKIAQRIRTKSQADKLHKSNQIMDVNPEFVNQIMQQYNAQRLIHGHTHRQAIHQENSLERIVLGDWGKTASLFKVNAGGYQLLNPY